MQVLYTAINLPIDLFCNLILIYMKLTNKALLLLYSPSKCSFTPSKLRFFGLRKPKNSSFYSTSHK